MKKRPQKLLSIGPIFLSIRYCQLAQNQPKSQYLFHKICSPRDLCIITLCSICVLTCLSIKALTKYEGLNFCCDARFFACLFLNLNQLPATKTSITTNVLVPSYFITALEETGQHKYSKRHKQLAIETNLDPATPLKLIKITRPPPHRAFDDPPSCPWSWSH